MKLIKYHGLTPDESEALSQSLDQLLSDYQVYRQNIRKMYWNVDLKPYLEFHHRLGQLYESTKVISNQVAGSILELGHNPSTEEGMFADKAQITALAQVTNFNDACLQIIQNSQELLHSVKEVFEIAAEYHEQSTMALMGQLARQLIFNIHFFNHMRMATLN